MEIMKPRKKDQKIYNEKLSNHHSKESYGTITFYHKPTRH